MSKIALCFLTYDNLSKPDIWNKFINSKYNIYIHNKNEFEGEFSKYCIKDKIETEWGDISLVKATLCLFKEAYKNKDNKYFILLSDKCIPLYNNEELYNIIHKYDNNLINCFYDNNERYDTFKDKTFIKYRNNFMKQSQWMCLNRETIEFFINNDYTDNFGENFEIPDEHYFINIIHKFHISYINLTLTYNEWIEHNSHMKEFTEITIDFIKECKKNDYLFIRKVLPETKISKEHLEKLS